jgi:hypothetical protein
MKEYLEDKDLIEVAKRSPELIFDHYSEIPRTEESMEAYRIASQLVKKRETKGY